MRGARCRCCCAALPACVPVVLASAAAMPRPAASAAVADTDGPLFISRRQPHPYSGVGSGGGSHGGGSPASPCRHTGQRRRPRPRWRRSRTRSTPAAPSCERAELHCGARAAIGAFSSFLCAPLFFYVRGPPASSRCEVCLTARRRSRADRRSSGRCCRRLLLPADCRRSRRASRLSSRAQSVVQRSLLPLPLSTPPLRFPPSSRLAIQ